MWTPVIVIREEPRQRIEPFIIGVVRALVGHSACMILLNASALPLV